MKNLWREFCRSWDFADALAEAVFLAIVWKIKTFFSRS